MKKVVIIYHADCRDGMGGAWVAYQKFGDTAEYIPCNNWKVLPEYLTENDISDFEVYIIDFSFEKETLLDLESKCKKLVVIDHHAGARDAIESVKNHVYGVGKSGAYLAWEYFFPGREVPIAIQYVSDSDTWSHSLPFYEEVGAYLYRASSELTLEKFDSELKFLEDKNNFEEAKKIGKILRQEYMSNVEKYEERAELINIFGYEVYAVNAPSELKSELGHRLAEKTNSFSLIYYYFEGKWRGSFRSVSDFDVSVLAKKLGGGGHKNAAAFHFKSNNPILEIVNKASIDLH